MNTSTFSASLRRRFVLGTNWVCPWDKLGFHCVKKEEALGLSQGQPDQKVYVYVPASSLRSGYRSELSRRGWCHRFRPLSAPFFKEDAAFLLTDGSLLLTVELFSFFTYNWSFFAYSWSFFCLQWEGASHKGLKGL